MIETDAMGQPLEVSDLDAQWLLALAAESRVECWKAERRLLRLAYQWCVLHPATDESGYATWSPAGLPGLETRDESIGGEGTPRVSAFSPEPFAAALRVSTLAGIGLMADTLDLHHRLPRLWKATEALRVAPWKARKIAQTTRHLSPAGARWVDAHLAQVTDRWVREPGWPSIEQAVAQATATHDPHLLEEREKTGRSAWDVTLQHRGTTTRDNTWAGTSHLDATGDTADLSDFYDLVCAHAAALKAAGDTDPLAVRKAKALGLIARGETPHDLTGQLAATPAPSQEPPPAPAPRKRKVKLYLHLDATHLLGDPGQMGGHGTVERLGPATVEKIREWVGHSHLTLTPVLDLARTDTTDAHDPPGWLRDLVMLRDPHCVFPHCNRHARACDLDHLNPYDPTGPPGQTSPANLAPLCRRHHRAKTARRWRYYRTETGAYHWTGPHQREYLVTPTGTTPLD